MASSVPGSSSAPVGQASMQSVHEPQSSANGWSRLELGVGDERAEHDPGAVPARDQHRVLAVEADSGARGRLAVDVVVRVDEHAVLAAEPPAERVELLPQRCVGVEPGVARQPSLPRPALRLRRVVAERRGDDRSRVREQCLGVARDLGPRHREAHVGEQAPLSALADVALGLLVRLGRRRADDVDPELLAGARALLRSSHCAAHKRVDTVEVPLRGAHPRAVPAKPGPRVTHYDRRREGNSDPRRRRARGPPLRGRARSRAGAGRGARRAARSVAEPPRPLGPQGLPSVPKPRILGADGAGRRGDGERRRVSSTPASSTATGSPSSASTWTARTQS